LKAFYPTAEDWGNPGQTKDYPVYEADNDDQFSVNGAIKMHTSVEGINFVGIDAVVTGKASEATENHYLLWYGQFSTTGTPKPVEEESETRLLQGTIDNESFAIVQ